MKTEVDTTPRGFGARIQDAETSKSESADSGSEQKLEATVENKEQIRAMLVEKKGEEYVQKLEKGELYANGACPMDPFEKVMCESCQ